MTSRIELAGATVKTAARWPTLLNATAILLASALLVSGCNTAKGLGDDVEEAAEEVGDAID